VVIQAKRFSNDRQVEIETAKALWSDIDEAAATRGVVATTSRLQPAQGILRSSPIPAYGSGATDG